MRQAIKAILRRYGLIEFARGMYIHILPEKAFLKQFIKPGSLCFDVGANVGHYTWKYEKLGARVIAIEPQLENFQVLLEEFGANENIVLLNKGLDDTFGERELFICDEVSEVSSMSQHWIDATKQSGRLGALEWRRSQIIEVITLDSLIQEYGVPDFCKIDVEGFEYNVLRGLSRPVKVISLEFTPEHIEPALKCIEHLCGLGKVEFNYALKREPRLVLSAWINGDALMEHIIQLPPDIYAGPAGDIYARFIPDGP